MRMEYVIISKPKHRSSLSEIRRSMWADSPSCSSLDEYDTTIIKRLSRATDTYISLQANEETPHDDSLAHKPSATPFNPKVTEVVPKKPGSLPCSLVEAEAECRSRASRCENVTQRRVRKRIAEIDRVASGRSLSSEPEISPTISRSIRRVMG